MRHAPLAVLVATLSAACLPASFPRSGEVLAPGQTGGAISSTIAPLEVQSATVGGVPSHGAIALPYGFEPLMIAGGFVGLIEFSGRIGLFSRCEGVGDFSVQRPGLELRCALVRPRGDARLSLATSTALVYAPLGSGMWGRFGLEAGGRLLGYATMLDLDVSVGPERHGMRTPQAATDPALEYNESGGGPHAYVVLNELRVSLPLGVAIPLEDGTGLRAGEHRELVVGLVPFVVLHAGAPKSEGCVACANVPVTDFRVPVGATLTLGYAWQGALPL